MQELDSTYTTYTIACFITDVPQSERHVNAHQARDANSIAIMHIKSMFDQMLFFNTFHVVPIYMNISHTLYVANISIWMGFTDEAASFIISLQLFSIKCSATAYIVWHFDFIVCINRYQTKNKS